MQKARRRTANRDATDRDRISDPRNSEPSTMREADEQGVQPQPTGPADASGPMPDMERDRGPQQNTFIPASRPGQAPD